MFAKLGKLVVLLEKANDDHKRTYSLLKAIVEGKFPKERVKMLDGGWAILPEPEEKDGGTADST